MSSQDGQAWERAPELPPVVVEVLGRPIGEIVVIVATVDADGAPRTAAFGSVIAMGPDRLRFACDRAHDTFANVLRDGRVMLALFSPPDVAVGIRGRARMIRRQLESRPSNAVLEVAVEEVKNDANPLAPVASGITFESPEEVATLLGRYMAEVASAGGQLGEPGHGRPVAGAGDESQALLQQRAGEE